jgi:predicted nucleotidyltransferase
MLEADARVAAAWLVGSRGRGDADALSDIDLVVVAHDAYLAELVSERRELVARLSPPLLIQDLPRNAPPGGAYLLVLYAGETGPLHVDWYWRAISGATLPYDARLIVERPGVSVPRQPPPAAATDDERALAVAHDVIFFWAIAPIAAKYLARRQPVEAFDLLRSAANALERTRREIDPAADGPAVPLSELLTTDAGAQVRALHRLCQEMAALLPRVEPLPPAAGSLSPDVPAHVLRFVDRIAALVTPT